VRWRACRRSRSASVRPGTGWVLSVPRHRVRCPTLHPTIYPIACSDPGRGALGAPPAAGRPSGAGPAAAPLARRAQALRRRRGRPRARLHRGGGGARRAQRARAASARRRRAGDRCEQAAVRAPDRRLAPQRPAGGRVRRFCGRPAPGAPRRAALQGSFLYSACQLSSHHRIESADSADAAEYEHAVTNLGPPAALLLLSSVPHSTAAAMPQPHRRSPTARAGAQASSTRCAARR